MKKEIDPWELLRAVCNDDTPWDDMRQIRARARAALAEHDTQPDTSDPRFIPGLYELAQKQREQRAAGVVVPSGQTQEQPAADAVALLKAAEKGLANMVSYQSTGDSPHILEYGQARRALDAIRAYIAATSGKGACAATTRGTVLASKKTK